VQRTTVERFNPTGLLHGTVKLLGKGHAMKKILLGLAAGFLALTVTGAANAFEPHRGVHHGPVVVRGPVYRGPGVRFSGGYYYTRTTHPNWGRGVWDAHYRRYHYWDPHLHIYYYWNPTAACYYPVTYCP
jgi:hypothetical protein